MCLPLTSGSRRAAGATYSAVAAIFVREATFDTPSPPEAIAKTYHLTPMELRILIAIVEVGGVPAVADALGHGRDHGQDPSRPALRQDRRSRQADLVKLVAGFSSPLGPSPFETRAFGSMAGCHPPIGGRGRDSTFAMVVAGA